MKNLSFLLKNGFEYLKLKRYHYVHSGLAKETLATIEESRGKTNSKELALCDEYAKDVLGWVGYAPWLKVYATFNNKFKEGWIPDNYYGSVVVPRIQEDYGKVSNLKSFSNRLFGTDHFPDILYHSNGRWICPKYGVVSADAVVNILFDRHSKVMFKPDNSMQGLGIQIMEQPSFQLLDLQNVGNGVFQYFVDQHSFYSDFSANAVATLRITTIIDAFGKGEVKATYLRLGRRKDVHVKSASQLKIPVNTTTGILDEIGYLEDWKSLTQHPDSGVLFKGKLIPKFNESVSLCLQLHQRYPQVACIGWDLTLNSLEQIKVLEWNGYHNDIKFSETTSGPCFTGMGWEDLWKKT